MKILRFWKTADKVSVSECFCSKAASPKLSTSMRMSSEEYSKCFRKAGSEQLQIQAHKTVKYQEAVTGGAL